jgi:hypothetical protein
MTPQPNTRIKLDELNKILDEMQQGENAVKRLAEMDKSRGLQDPADVVRRMRGNQNESVIATDGLIGDQALAQQRLDQAAKMEREANGLLAEAKRLTDEAKTLNPALAKPAKKAKVTVVTEAVAPVKVKKPRAKVSV